MKVNRVILGDILNAVVTMKTRPCVVIGINHTNKTVILVPLTTESEKTSDFKVGEAPGLHSNRFLKEKSYFVYSIVTIPLEKAKSKFAGTTKKETYKHIKEEVTAYLKNNLDDSM